MPTHNLHSRMNNFFQRREEERINREHCGSSTRSNSNTLQSVLRGEIPSEYLHLTSLPNEQRQSYVTSQFISDGDQHIIHRRHHQIRGTIDTVYNNSPVHRNIEVDCPDMTNRPSTSPCGTTHRMSPYGRSPSHGVPPVFRNYQEDICPSEQYCDRRSPSYHNSRSSPYCDPGSPYSRQGNSPHVVQGHRASPVRPYSPYISSSHSPLLAPNSPVSAHYSPYHSSDEMFINSNEQPIDLSFKAEKSPASTPELVLAHVVETSESQSNGSMLRNLLILGKQNASRVCDRDSPCSDVTKPDVPVSGSTPVTLAKKMIHPITSRVSDWLVKIVQFSKSIPEFSNMSSNDKLTLLANSWARILLLFMAENEFEFAVTPIQTPESQSAEGTNMDECPTMKSVETIQSFIRKCKNMNLDQKEYALLRMSVLFNTGHVGLDNPEIIEKLNAAVQQLLQQHVTTTRPDDAMHYSRILMCLPTLYGINCKMIENLFCHGIHPNIDMDVLLLEMLKNL